ncbi:hypothetical protein KFL_000800115 [Klebsormidium nitens]|uniref:Uncharacterized protein n=1 Tax=Klebsormidium nitens TaxID=105231 RepID=A0A1Y1HTH8_KLENI|nr:hypothetical protein KFL_000800115 [Klebsormidium nitens]|eukprot:GAQ81433.1 hypothetical protein KFL_000800115 [Klebsormidium nitens]
MGHACAAADHSSCKGLRCRRSIRCSWQEAGSNPCQLQERQGALCWLRKLRRHSVCCRAASDGTNSQPQGCRSLDDVCQDIEKAFSEVCVENLGRPAAAALFDFVAATVEAYMLGASRDKVTIQLQYGSKEAYRIERDVAGYRLTGSEERYRSQWLDVIYTTLQLLKQGSEEWRQQPATQDESLIAIIHRVLEGQRTGEEQSLVKFDRALSTAGASGGATSERRVVAPQWIPVTQLVLLTMKVLNERG